jgi:hypothetical protein
LREKNPAPYAAWFNFGKGMRLYMRLFFFTREVFTFRPEWQILENWYDERLLNFFSNSLSIPNHPEIEDHCLLWRDRYRIVT